MQTRGFRLLLRTTLRLAAVAALSACGGGSSGTSPSAVTVYAAGDIARCGRDAPERSAAARTAALVESFGGSAPLLLLGDLAYAGGTTADFEQCYDPTWGRFKTRSHPVPGNHEYRVPGAADYFRYFGSRAGAPDRGYYSLNIGGWHVIALNSNLPMAAGSAQEAWLRADLAARKGRPCTLAFWHHPRYSSSSVHGDDPRSTPVWAALHEAGADVVLVGHDHTYERFAPQDAEGRADASRGIREFVVGTGGASLYAFGPARPNSEARIAGHYGVLRLDLGQTGYAWRFTTADGDVADEGAADCAR